MGFDEKSYHRTCTVHIDLWYRVHLAERRRQALCIFCLRLSRVRGNICAMTKTASDMSTTMLEPEAPLLGEQLCFALYSTHLAMGKVYRQLLQDLGVTYPQYLVLLVLWESGALTVSEISARLFLDSPTLTPLLKRMEVQGLVLRTRDRVDERKVLVALTPQGRALRKRARAVYNGVAEASGCSAQELQSLRDQLLMLRERLFRAA
jgi:DNA-binding MarR family transcriptional regulator